MAYQPTLPKPYLTSIDATLVTGNVFSIVLNPKDIIAKYNLTIYDAESNERIYTTGIVTLIPVLYGSLDSGTTLDVVVPSSSGIQNGYNYTWSITLYDIDDNSVTTPLYYFIARTSPSIDFSVDSVITSCEYEFTATYSQKQGESYLYYTFSLYSNGVLIDTSGEKMESKISYSYTSFMSDTQYRIDLTVVMNDRTEYTLSRNFSVSYNSQETPVFPIVQINKSKGYLDIDYSQSIYIAGHTNNTEQYTTFKNVDTATPYVVTQLADGQYVYYDKINETKPIDISEGFTIYLHENFLDLFTGTIIELTDELTGEVYTVRYDSKCFYYKIPGIIEISIDPYVDDSFGIHKERSCIHSAGTTKSSLQYDTLYMLYPSDVITDGSVFMYNDITKNFWWHITLLPDKVIFIKGDKYIESVVS